MAGDAVRTLHVVIQVDSLHATVAELTARGVQAEGRGSPDGSEEFWTSWITDPDGYRIELVQWSAGGTGAGIRVLLGLRRRRGRDGRRPTSSARGCR
jgi:hypothetical protein